MPSSNPKSVPFLLLKPCVCSNTSKRLLCRQPYSFPSPATHAGHGCLLMPGICRDIPGPAGCLGQTGSRALNAVHQMTPFKLLKEHVFPTGASHLTFQNLALKLGLSHPLPSAPLRCRLSGYFLACELGIRQTKQTQAGEHMEAKERKNLQGSLW